MRGNIINKTACSVENVSETEINAFGAFYLSTQNAIYIGAISSIPFGLAGETGNTTSYTLKDAKLLLLDADELANIIDSPSCKARIAAAAAPVWIVRGVIKAKRSYKFYHSMKLSITRKGADAPSLEEDGGARNDGETDDAARPYFLILSPVKSVTVPSVPSSNDPGKGTDLANCATKFPVRIYIQRARQEPESTGITVRDALNKNFNVENHIEPVDVTPKAADVRYYNDDDLGAAKCALLILAVNGYPNAKLNRRETLKPPQYLQIWLPRKP